MSGFQNSLNHYAGSIEFEDENGEWTDRVITAIEYNDFISKMKDFKNRRKEGRIFFAVHVVNGEERNITDKVKRDIHW